MEPCPCTPANAKKSIRTHDRPTRRMDGHKSTASAWLIERHAIATFASPKVAHEARAQRSR